MVEPKTEVTPEQLNRLLAQLHREQKEELVRSLYAAKEAQKLERVRNSLTEYACYVDPYADRDYQKKWGENPYRAAHLQLIASYLEKVERGEEKRLMIFTPPRFWKSSIVSDKFPGWLLGKHPEWPMILISHTLSLAEKFSRSIRDTVRDNLEYRELFPGTVLRDDAANAEDWSTTKAYRSSVRAVGIGGGIVGHGARIIVIDDPVKDQQQALSRTEMDHQWEWYQYTLTSRIEEETAIILMMTRWVEDDLGGRLIQAMKEGGDKWTILRIPRVAESQEQRDRVAKKWGMELGQPDPLGRKTGQRLWPNRFSERMTRSIMRTAGPRAANAMHQQNPQAQQNRILDSGKLRRVKQKDLPAMKRLVRSWDLAFTDRKASDFLCGTLIGEDDQKNKYIMDIAELKGRWTANKAHIIEHALFDGPNVTVLIESNGTQSGYYDDVKDDEKLKGKRLVEEIKPSGSKEMRASIWGSHLDDGTYFVVEADWNDNLFNEMDDFPGLTDHQVDSISNGLSHLGVSNVPKVWVV